MTLVEQAIERLRALPQAERESAAETVLAIVEQYEHPSALTPEQIEEVMQADRDLRDGKLRLLTDDEMTAMWRRFRA